MYCIKITWALFFLANGFKTFAQLTNVHKAYSIWMVIEATWSTSQEPSLFEDVQCQHFISALNAWAA